MSTALPASPRTDTSRDLTDLLGTIDRQTFLDTYLGEQMLHVPGAADRWRDLCSWADINRLLNTGFVPHPRVRLVKAGVDVDPALFTYERGTRRWPESARCQEQMAEGATLIVESIDGLNPRLDDFVRQLECDLSADVHVDVVATCVPVAGLRMHWDDAECFNLQLDGEKHWEIVPPEHAYPLKPTKRFPHRTDVVNPPGPTTTPAWTGRVAAGDLLYLPRGWWHAVTPVTTPSLHLSLAVDIPTFSDFLRWSARAVTTHTFARRPLPVWQSAAQRRDRFAAILTELAANLSPELVDRYLDELRASATARNDFALPQAAAAGGPTLTPTTSVRRRSTAPLRWRVDDGMLMIEQNGETYRVDARLEPLVQKLANPRAFTLDQLAIDLPRFVVNAFLLALLKGGMLTLADPDRAGRP